MLVYDHSPCSMTVSCGYTTFSHKPWQSPFWSKLARKHQHNFCQKKQLFSTNQLFIPIFLNAQFSVVAFWVRTPPSRGAPRTLGPRTTYGVRQIMMVIIQEHQHVTLHWPWQIQIGRKITGQNRGENGGLIPRNIRRSWDMEFLLIFNTWLSWLIPLSELDWFGGYDELVHEFVKRQT